MVEKKHFNIKTKESRRHYYTRHPDTEPKMIIIKFKYKDIEFKIYSSTSIFSKSHIDPASQLLIDRAKVFGDVLDMGCGYGVVGIVLKKLNPEINMYMSDINSRAVHLAKKNLMVNNVPAEIKHGWVFEPWKNRKFDVILINPPMSAGREVCMQMIRESFYRLNKGGMLEIVSNHNKGGNTLKEYMYEKFNNVEDLAKKGGFRVYASKKTSAD